MGPDGQTTLVEIKAGDRDFAGVNLARAWAELGQVDDRREIWGFKLERLSLGAVWSGRQIGPGFMELPALDVWEFNQDGTVFDRCLVVAEVNEWSRHIDATYTDVEAWAHVEGVTTTRDRSVPMSEELMQRFAVSDRAMPILDIMDGTKPVVSMVPSGLWMIGANGLIDVITRRGTFRLTDEPRMSLEPPVWALVDFRSGTRSGWGHEAFRSILGLVPAGE